MYICTVFPHLQCVRSKVSIRGRIMIRGRSIELRPSTAGQYFELINLKLAILCLSNQTLRQRPFIRHRQFQALPNLSLFSLSFSLLFLHLKIHMVLQVCTSNIILMSIPCLASGRMEEY